jgi:protein-S-isoprenylcysteine O-methyltransferase Ste14
MADRTKSLALAGWVITVAVSLYLLRDVSPDLQQAPWVVKANAAFGIPADAVFLIGAAGLVCTLAYAFSPTSMLGAILLTGFLGGAIFAHVRVNGSAWDIGENVLIGVLAWAGLWLRDERVRALLPVRRSAADR